MRDGENNLEDIRSLEKIGINDKGYSDAIRYYSLLKERMIKQIIENTKQSAEIKNFAHKLNQDLSRDLFNKINSKEKNESGEKKRVEELMKYVDGLVEQTLVGSPANVQDKLKTIVTDIQEKKVRKNTKDLNRLYLNRIKSQQKNILNSVNIKSFLPPEMAKFSKGATTDITNQVSSYFTRALVKRLWNEQIFNGLDIHRESYINSLSGFYKEDADYNLYLKFFEKVGSKLKVYHTGGETVSINSGKKVQTELDILVTKINNLQEALQRNETFKERLLTLSNEDIADIQKHLLNQINWFGTQTKSWSLDTGFKSYGIGQRSALYSDFTLESGVARNNGKPVSQLQSIQYLARVRNIMLALGPANAIFSTGEGRMWTADFISKFRELNYYLAFNKHSDKLTSYVILKRMYSTGFRR